MKALFLLIVLMIFSSCRLHFRSFQSPALPQKGPLLTQFLVTPQFLLCITFYLGMLHHILSSKAESNDTFQALQVASSAKAEAPLTLISVSLLFCFLVVSFAVCHAVALPWFMSCLCFVSVSIPLHLKCPALPPPSLTSVNSSNLSFFSPHSSASTATR